jgi:hypothetical protein
MLGLPRRPQHWIIGNQTVALGWLVALLLMLFTGHHDCGLARKSADSSGPCFTAPEEATAIERGASRASADLFMKLTCKKAGAMQVG